MKTLLPAVNKRVYNLQSKQLVKLYSQVAVTILQFMNNLAGHEIAPDTGANVTKFFTLMTKSCKLVTKLATRMFHHNLTKRYSELKRVAKINPQQTSLLSLFPKCSTCISIDNQKAILELGELERCISSILVSTLQRVKDLYLEH